MPDDFPEMLSLTQVTTILELIDELKLQVDAFIQDFKAGTVTSVEHYKFKVHAIFKTVRRSNEEVVGSSDFMFE